MPIYEYACPGCGARFGTLVARVGEAVSCPTCQSPDVEKQLSVFAVKAAAPAVAGPPGRGATPAPGTGAARSRRSRYPRHLNER